MGGFHASYTGLLLFVGHALGHASTSCLTIRAAHAGVRRVEPHQLSAPHFQPWALAPTAVHSMHRLAVLVLDVEIVLTEAVVGPPR